ncbi:hypothetical protein BC831DRAFT_469695 [Entophlyctis helioformis]|nr:hypothetical protein BC831DRAFT_469695 [Entophlyctis helioformis]
MGDAGGLAQGCRRIDSLLEERGLRLVPSAAKHRSIVAARHIPRGSTLLVEPSLATVWLSDTDDQSGDPVCSRCRRTSTALKRCSSCKSVAYCSTACQRSDWTDAGHRLVCTVLRTHPSLHPSSPASLDLVMLARVHAAVSRLPETDPQVASLASLLGHADDPTTAAAAAAHSHDAADLFAVALHPSPSTDPDARSRSKTAAAHRLRQFRCNNFTATNNELFALGECLQPLGSLFNHSCCPNAVAVYDVGDGRCVLVVRSIRDVAVGEEVCISYVDTIAGLADRRRHLQRYGFVCECERCLSEAESAAGQDGQDGESRQSGQGGQHGQDTTKSGIKSHEQMIRVGWQVVDWHVQHKDDADDGYDRAKMEWMDTLSKSDRALLSVGMLHEAGNAFSDHLSSGDGQHGLEQAMPWGLLILAIHLMGYPRFHPMPCVQATAMARLVLSLNDCKNAVKLGRLAQDFILVAYGPDMPCPMRDSVKALLREALRQ